jgi:Arc/MetJ-type ribon-helix-helix transcriptional regulator
MRTAITISLPEALAKSVRQEVKKGNFASASEYFRHILRERAETKLLARLKRQQKQFRAGKGIVLKSLADLD